MLKTVFHFLPFTWLMITLDSNRIHYFFLHSIFSILAQKKEELPIANFHLKKKNLFEPKSLLSSIACIAIVIS